MASQESIHIQKAWAKLYQRIVLTILMGTAFCCSAAQTSPGLKWSMDYTAGLVLKRLSTPQERAAALQACRRLHISKVYLEVTEGDRASNPAMLRTIKDFFQNTGIEASALVATTGLPKPSTVPSGAACYTNRGNQKYVTRLFQDAAATFNEIIIDDWLFTDCECSECAAAKGSMSWEQYRKQLMLDVSRDDILDPARKVNPDVRIILKYPNWYDNYQKWGYQVTAETALFDRIWVGTEVRDPSSEEHKQQYGAFFLYRWLSGIGGRKTGGAWFDLYATSPDFYLDQAYVSVLAGAPEIMLYSDSHAEVSSPKYQEETQALIDREPNLEALAKLVGNWQGIAAYKPPSSSTGDEPYIFDQVGMLGIPLMPVSKFPRSAKMAFFADYAMSDAKFIPELVQFFDHGGTAFVSEDLARRLNQDPRLPVAQGLRLAKNELLKTIHEGNGEMIVFSDSLPAHTYVDFSNRVQQMTPSLNAALLELRKAIGKSVPLTLDAPPRVAVFPMGRRIAIMNFTELPVDCHLTVPGRMSRHLVQIFSTPGTGLREDRVTLHLPAHGLLMVESIP